MSTLVVTVNSPCTGAQTVSQVVPTLYQGSTGNFTFAVLAGHPTYGWLLVVYDQANPSGPCYPNAQYGQVTPNPSDPKGLYGLLPTGTTTPDTTAGSANVT